MIYQVKLKHNNHCIVNLPWGDEADTVILHTYEDGTYIMRMYDKKMMQNSLQDLCDNHHLVEDGDEFHTEFGNFVYKNLNIMPL